MKTFLSILIILIVQNFGNSQNPTCDCKAELDFLVEKQKKMPSYKRQIKGNKEELYNNTYQRLVAQMSEPIEIEACYKLLLEQKLTITDLHSSLKMTYRPFPMEILKDSVKLNGYIASYEFKNHPSYSGDIKKLKSNLSKVPESSLEGLYETTQKETIGIYSDGEGQLTGVVLESPLKQWLKGQIRFYLKRNGNGKFNMYAYNTNTKAPRFVEALTFENGRIWNYKKIGNSNNYEFKRDRKQLTEFKQINDSTKYIYIGSFNNSNKRELTSFINEMKTELNTDNIIIDLRSNSGGNSKFSDPFIKMLKGKNVYVITNAFTGSNGEQFTLKLKSKLNAIHLGQTTFGVIAYGRNYGYSYDSPSGYFSFTPTDMNFHKFIDYEAKGVTPDIKLDFDRDWIEQTIEIIGKDNQS